MAQDRLIQNIFIKRENGLIKQMTTAYDETITDWEKIPSQNDLDEITKKSNHEIELANALALISEFEAYMKSEGEYSPDNTMTYAQKRQQSISKGGYGTWQEQMEIMNEQGFAAWQAHCAQVKSRYPKE